MPLYIVNNKRIYVADDKVGKFMSKHPDAKQIGGTTTASATKAPSAPSAPSAPKPEEKSSLIGDTNAGALGSLSDINAAKAKEKTNEDKLTPEQREELMRRTKMRSVVVGAQVNNGSGLTTPKLSMIGTPKQRFELNKEGEMASTFEDMSGKKHPTFMGAAVSDAQKRYENDNTARGRLMRAYKELKDLEEKEKEVNERDKKNSKKTSGFVGNPMAMTSYMPSVRGEVSDEAFAINASIQIKKDEIARLERAISREQGESVGVGSGLSSLGMRDFTFGLADLSDARLFLEAEDKMKNGNTAEKEAYTALLRAKSDNDKTASMYPDTWGYRMGEMGADMVPFMLDLASLKGVGGGIKAGSKWAAKKAAKKLGEEAAEEMAKKGIVGYVKSHGWKGLGDYATDYGIKFLGGTLDDIANAAILTNTVQAGKTAADVVGRKLGNVKEDEDGNLSFENSKTWGDAIWQAEANSIIENMSELSGDKLFDPLSLKNIKGYADVIGAKRVSDMLTKWDNKSLNGAWKYAGKLLEGVGINSITQEVGEEYYGQLWRTILGLDDAYNAEGKNLFLDKQFHKDVWGGIALTMGAMKVPQAGLAGATYVSQKHQVNKADKKASALFDADMWTSVRNVIDNTTNDNFGDVVLQINTDKELSPEQKAAATEYAGRLAELRGFNLASMKQEKSPLMAMADGAFVSGYGITQQEEMKAARQAYEDALDKFSNVMYGDTKEDIERDPMSYMEHVMQSTEFTEEEKAVYLDYLNAKSVYDGMVFRVRHDIDEVIADSDAKIDSFVYRENMTIQPATLKVGGRSVYVIAGLVESNEDGTINKDKSGESIVIRDAETGKLEQVSPDAILSLGGNLDPFTEKQVAADLIRQRLAQEAEDKVEGVVSGAELYVSNNGVNEIARVHSVDGDNVTVVAADGTMFPMSKDDVILGIRAKEREEKAAGQADIQADEQASVPIYDRQDEFQVTDEKGNVFNVLVTERSEDGYTLAITDANGNEVAAPFYTKDRMTEVFPIETPVAPVSQEQTAVDNVLQDKLTPGAELVIRDENGEEHYIVVMGRAYDNNGMYMHDPNGDIIQYYMDGDVKYEQESVLRGKVVQREDATPVSQEHAQGDSVETQGSIEQEKPTYVRDGKTRVAYHMIPVADTIQELFGMGMEVADVQSVAESNVAEAESDIKKHEKKQPKQKTDFADPAEFIAAKQKWQVEMQEWQAEMDDINARLAYWEGVQAELDKVAHTEMETESVVSNEVVETPESYIANYLGGTNGVKITPESFKAETGFGAEEQKKMVGVSIERAAEIIFESGGLQELGFQGDENDVRNIIIDILSEGNPRSYAKRQAQEAYDREREAELAYEENQKQAFAEELGFNSYDDYLAYEEIALPVALSRYSGFNESEYYSNLADKYYQTENEYEQQGIDSEPEVAGTIGSGEVLQGEQPISTERTEDINIEQQGGTVQAGMQGSIEDATASEEEIIEESVGIGQNTSTIGEQVQAAEAEVNTNPTDKQKEAGNYKKGHVQIGTFNVTIEQPKGSVRSGVDKGGKKWEVEMQNTYGYIRGTEGVDGDHIDVFLSDDIDGWDGHKVFVVDQRNADGSFDEHKVMLGFNDINEAEAAYMSNYEEGWQGLGAITGVSIEEFEKWIASSHRKTKAFAEYKSVKTTEGQSASAERRNLADFKEGDVVRDYYDKKLYRIKKHSKNGVSTIAMLDEEGNEVDISQMNAHNNSRYSLAEAPVKAETPTVSQESEQVSNQESGENAGKGGEKQPRRKPRGFRSEVKKTSAGVRDKRSDSVATKLTDEKKSENSDVKAEEKIEDVGEVLAGARKDALKVIASSFENATIQSLIELPFAKAFKKPDLKKAVDSGALREEDAAFYEAWFSTMVNTAKPKLSRRVRESHVRSWAEEIYKSLQVLKEFVRADVATRDRIVAEMMANKFPTEAEELAKIEQRKEWNKGSNVTWGDKTTPNRLWVAHEVLKRLGYKSGDKIDIPYGILQANATGTGYDFYNNKGQRLVMNAVATVEEGIDRIVYLTKLKRGDTDVKHPVSSFTFVPTKTDYAESGRYRVVYGSVYNPSTKEFDSPSEAEAFAKNRKDAFVSPIKEVSRQYAYKVRFVHPLTGEKMFADEKEFDTRSEAEQYLQEQYDAVNEHVNDELAKARGEKRALSADDVVEVVAAYKGGKIEYVVSVHRKYANNMGMPLPLRAFATRAEAVKYASEIKDDIFKAVQQSIEDRKAFTFFATGEDTRIGEDYRQGKDVTAEEFMDAFGFRGVQFGNWTNQRDRQMAVNQAYDALHDLAKLLGVSPKALSLNGELGIAFGSRGSGNANAHYELDEVVINLTKTRGAGSLAHEWWHALDNYFARNAEVPHGMVTDSRKLAMRDELRMAFNELLELVDKSKYLQRSKARGDYWGRMHEVTARLLAEWVDQSLKANGEVNTFLSRGADVEKYKQMNYKLYKRATEVAGETPMPYEEFAELDAALDGMPYPTAEEVSEFGSALRRIFDVMQERETDDGKVALFNIADESLIAERDSEAFKRATEHTIDALKAAGVEVVEATDAMVEEVLGLAEMHKQKKAPETVSVQDEHLQTVVSSADGAKVLKDLDSAITEYENDVHTKEKTFLGRLAEILGATKHGSNSQYATFEAVNGKVFTIRLANHNAKVSNFDNHGENDGISIVVTAQDNNGVNNDGNAHVVEFFYDAIKLRKADGKPLVEILKSIKQALYSGEYKDTTGLAQAEEVNIPELMQVYHGSSSNFDKFDHSFMGTGEGHQAFGWGTYVSEVKGIAKTYAGISGQTMMTYKGQELDTESFDSPWRIIKDLYGESGGRLRDMRNRAERILGMVEEDNVDMKQLWQNVVDTLKKVRAGELKVKQSRQLYTVEIPDENGNNYLYHGVEVPTNVKRDVKQRLYEVLAADEAYKGAERELRQELDHVFNLEQDGATLYGNVSAYLGSDKAASEFLNAMGFAGIKYPTSTLSGGNKDGSSNYVIFNDGDLQITDRVQFLRTADGVVYGWAVGGKVYLTKDGMNPNTPAHEYTHLWAQMVEQTDPQLWGRIVDGLRGCATWNDVLNDKAYEGIWNDDNRMASEVLSRLTGAENYRREMACAQEEIANANGVFDKAEKISAWEQVKMALRDFLGKVKSLFGFEVKESGERRTEDETDVPAWMEFVDMVLGDLYAGVNPKAEGSPLERMQVVEERGDDAQSVETITTEFGFKPTVMTGIINSRDNIDSLKNILYEDLYERVLSAYNDGCTGYSLSDSRIVFVFKENCRDRYEEQITWWHEHTHVAFNNIQSTEKSRLAEIALNWIKENAEYKYDVIMTHYDDAHRESEIVAVFVEELVDRYGTSNFMTSDFANLGELAKLADIIRNSIKNGTEDTNRKIKEGYRFGEPFAQSAPRGNRIVENSSLRRKGLDGGSESVSGGTLRQTPKGSRVLSESNVAKRESAVQLGEKLNTPINIVEDVNDIADPTLRKKKGWYDTGTGQVTVVLPNNRSAEDVAATVAHEVVAHKGLRELVGEVNYNEFLDETYKHLRGDLKSEVDAAAGRAFMDDAINNKGRAKSLEHHRRNATDELYGRMAEKPFEEFTQTERTLWVKLKESVRKFLDKFLGTLKLPKWFTLGDNELRYILWRSRERMVRGKESPIEDARDIVKREELGLSDKRGEKEEGELLFRDMEETEDIWSDHSMGLHERITAAAARLANNHSENKTLRNDAMRAIGGNLSDLRKAMSHQRQFDISTVKRVADLARVLMNNGLLNDMNKQEIKRLLGAVKSSVGRNDIEGDVQKVLDIMVDNQLRNGENALHKLETIKGSKVNAKGVEVQGELDAVGQQIMQAFKKTRGWEKTDIEEAIADAQQRIGSNDSAVAEEAANEHTGLQLALEYAENIKESKIEERKLRDEIKQAHEDTSASDRATDGYRQYIASLEDAIRQNRIERAQRYFDLVGKITGSLRESISNAQEFKAAEQQRIGEIHHDANSDMQGRPSNEHYKPTFMGRVANNSFASFLLAPLATFDQMLRLFGGKSANGEGYLYNRFMRGWVDARQQEINGVRNKFATLDKKAAELFGWKVKSWSGLIRLVSKLPKSTIEFRNGGEMKEYELSQGHLMYIYMVDKMLDGRMKLRKMGITEDDVADIKEAIDPRLIQLADWLQDEFLVETRNEYNETHKRVFGASMASVEHYFPLKILANARADRPEDLDNPDRSDGISTTTGSIIKRRRNSLPLDILNADALHVILDHITQMEHWNAYAEFNRDLNILRTYKRFRNQVQNMTSVYGSGKELWKKFNEVCQVAAGTYRPPRAKLDEAAVNFAKGVTAAKVSFRLYTALKQFLSAPAYIPEARVDYLLQNIINPAGAWTWAMKNLPIFNERWHSRMAGDPRLLKSDMDWKQWRSRVVQLASRVGMSPNAFVDALTVSIGAHAMYQTRLAQYLKDGYSKEEAERKANQDAEVLYNQTQQSSEGAFLSTMQVDRSWLSVMFTIFRNASMAYQRQLHDAARNLRHNLTPGGAAEGIEFMKKQYEREGFDENQASTNAKRKYRRQLRKDILRIATYGYIMQFAWNLGMYLPYFIFGDNEEEKQKMWDDVMTHTAFGWTEGFSGGDVISAAGNMWLSGEWNPEYLTKEMPITSDIMSALKKLGSGRYAEALNDVVNVVVQAGIGVNPQSIEDAVIAIFDACGDDPELTHETAIFISRILQVPQSQIDKLYFDEIDLSGSEVSKYTPEQLARRYAEIKVKRGQTITPWTWDDEEALGTMEKRTERSIKERIEQTGDNEVNESYLGFEEVYNNVSQQMKAAKEMAKDDPIEAAQMYSKIDRSDYATYESFKKMNEGLNKIVNFYLDSKNSEEAALCKQAIVDYKSEMVNVLEAKDNKSKTEAINKLAKVADDFSRKYTKMK